MIGAIIGDIVGSVYEWHNIKTKEFPLFQDKCFFTDDTVMTIAVAEGLLNGGASDDFIDAMAAITGSIAEAAYGVPEELKDKAWEYLDEPLWEVLRRWEKECN